MSRSIKIFLAASVGVIFLIYFLSGLKERPVNWQKHYSLDYKNPFDLYVFSREADTLFPKNKFIITKKTFYNYIWDNKDVPRNYLKINVGVYDDIDSLMLKSVKNGSNLFISAETIFHSFIDSLGIEYTDLNYMGPVTSDDSLYVTLITNSWGKKSYKIKPYINTYYFVNLDKKTTTILGESKLSNGDIFPNFIKIKYGKGNIFLHSEPVVFTNFEMLKKVSSASYAAQVLAYLPKNMETVWLANGQTKGSIEDANKTPLSVIFEHPALRATWLIFIYGLLLYILFNVKRRQRIVPIIKPLKNTTVEFTQTIGNMYFQDKDATQIVSKQIIYFLEKIRNRYYLDTTHLDDNFSRKLQSKSGKDLLLIKEIVQKINKFYKNEYAEKDDLVALNNQIEQFWDIKEQNQ